MFSYKNQYASSTRCPKQFPMFFHKIGHLFAFQRRYRADKICMLATATAAAASDDDDDDGNDILAGFSLLKTHFSCLSHRKMKKTLKIKIKKFFSELFLWGKSVHLKYVLRGKVTFKTFKM